MARYGDLVATTPRGRYFWARAIQCISFVPKGRQAATETKPMSDWALTPAEVHRAALAMEGIKLFEPETPGRSK